MQRKPSSLREACKQSFLIFIFELFGTTGLTIMYRLLVYPEYKINDVPIFLDEDKAVYPALSTSFLFGYWIISFISVNISGAHYNPAITFSYLFKRDTGFTRVQVIFYFIAQFAGGFLGAFLAWIITKQGGDMAIKEKDNAYLFQAIVMEILATFLYALIFLIQSDPTTRMSSDVALNQLFLSFAVGSFVFLARPISGGPLNPAAGVGIS